MLPMRTSQVRAHHLACLNIQCGQAEQIAFYAAAVIQHQGAAGERQLARIGHAARGRRADPALFAAENPDAG